MKIGKIAAVLGIVMAVGAAIAVQRFGADSFEKPEPVVVSGYVGGEKKALIENPEVLRILAEKHGITPKLDKAGSIEMVTSLNTAGKDVLWPSNALSAEIYAKTSGHQVSGSPVFNSPIVLYTWSNVAEALVKEGVVATQDDVYYVVDLFRLVDMVAQGTPWEQIGLGELYGDMMVYSTDPLQSNSGNMFAALVAATFNEGPVTAPADVDASSVEIRKFFDRMGFKTHSSGDIFSSFVKVGCCEKPIIVGYENQMVEFMLENERYAPRIKSEIKVLYPKPTVWAGHPIIPLTENGKRFAAAFEDPEILKLAWERHGFRSGVSNDPSVFGIAGIPERLHAAMPLPAPETMDRIMDSLK